MRLTKPLAVLVGVAMLALTACGGDASPPPDAGAANTEADASTESPTADAGTDGSASEDQGQFDASGDEVRAALQQDAWWYPALSVDCEAPDTEAAGCVGERIEGVYNAIPSSDVSEEWTVCMVVPHLKDPYWVAVNYGAVQEAERLGIRFQMLEAGGYTELATQVNQIDDCVASGAQAVIVGAISYDGLNAKIDQLIADGIVVIDGLNGVSNPDVDGRALVDWRDMGAAAAEYLVDLDEAHRVAWFPGPPGAGWAESANDGFHETLEGTQVEVVETKFGDTGKEVQLSLVEDTMQAYENVDVIAGTAVTAEAAAVYMDQRNLEDVSIVADYMVPTTLDLLQNGDATCAITDQPVIQARMTVDMAVRILEDLPLDEYRRVGPAPQRVCGPAAGERANLSDFVPEATFAPEDWDPVFNVE